MRINAFLIVSKSGNLRVLKTEGSIRPNEIRIALNLTVPDSYFRRPEPVVSIVLPAPDAPTEDDLNVIVDMTAATVADALQVDVDHVRDGLMDAINATREGEVPSHDA